MASFDILNYNLEALDEKIAKLNRKAKKLGLEPIKTHVWGFTPGYRIDTLAVGSRWVPARTTVLIEGARPVLPGFKFVATLEHLKTGTIIRAVPGQVVPPKYHNAKALCEHCNLPRSRKDTYLVKRESDDAIFQLGRTCVKDFCGGATPQAMAAVLTIEKDLENFCTELGANGARVKPIFPVFDVLAQSAAVIRVRGWVPKALAMNSSLESTASIVITNFTPTPNRKEEYKVWLADQVKVTDADKSEAQSVLNWLDGINKSNGSYLNNLHILSKEEAIEVPGRNVGLLVSAIAAFQKDRDKLKKIEFEKPKNSVYVGTVGQRTELELVYKGARVIGKGFAYNSGSLELVNFEDKNGNEFVWFTNSRPNSLCEIGETYRLKVTVKKHSEFRGKKQTVINRVNLTS